MGLLDEVMKDDAQWTFDTDQFAEQVTYYPRVGSSRTINAIVNREPPVIAGAVNFGQGREWQVVVRNHATLGIAATGLDIGGDFIGIVDRVGGTARRMGIAKLIAQDAGFLTLLVN